MMLSHDLRDLAKTFDDWTAGRAFPSVDDWAAFQRDLKTCTAKAALLEFGIGVNVLDVAAALVKPDSNVLMFPTAAQRQQMRDLGSAQ